MKKLRILVVALLALGYLAPLTLAIDFKTREQYGAQRTYSARTSIVSSHTVTGFGLSWSLTAIGGGAGFSVKHSTVTGGDLNVNVSSIIYVIAGQSINGRFEGIVTNPLISIDTVDTPGTTTYIDIDYLAPRGAGGL